MTTPSPQEVTQLLLAWSQGDRSALDCVVTALVTNRRQWADTGTEWSEVAPIAATLLHSGRRAPVEAALGA